MVRRGSGRGARTMRDEDRETLAEHGRRLERIEHDVGELKMIVRRIEEEHGAMLRAIADKLGID